MRNQRVPSHIPSFDALISGGFLPGSTVLLLSEYGAGGREFLQTSAVNCFRSKTLSKNNTLRYLSSRAGKETFLQNMQRMFKISPEQFFEYINFEESTSHLPAANLNDQRIYIDSLTRFLPRLDDTAWYAVLDSFYDYTKAAKEKTAVSLFLCSKGSLPHNREAELQDCFDAVFTFRWTQTPGSPRRNREFCIEKYDGMPFFAAPHTYHVRILPESGLEISNLKLIQ